jgi:hypothetical protein
MAPAALLDLIDLATIFGIGQWSFLCTAAPQISREFGMAAEKLDGRNSWLMSRFPVRLPEGFHGQLVCVRLLCGAGDDGDLGSVGPI